MAGPTQITVREGSGVRRLKGVRAKQQLISSIRRSRNTLRDSSISKQIRSVSGSRHSIDWLEDTLGCFLLLIVINPGQFAKTPNNFVLLKLFSKNP